MRISDLIEGENIIFGPPGTGKTTTLSRLVEEFVGLYGPDKILITSFTNAAAREIVGRQLPVPDYAVNTLHGHAFRALGRPALVAERTHEWNEAYPSWAISGEGGGSDASDDVVQVAQTPADAVYHKIQQLRARRIPFERWVDMQAIEFYKKWVEWKHENDLYDFTDLIEVALNQVHATPFGARVLIADEAQDFTKLEIDLIRQWGKNCTYLIFSGDDDQNLYYFKGADPEAFISPHLEPERKHVLEQSYRVPYVVQQIAERWIKRVAVRQEKVYRPRAERGRYRNTVYTFKHADEVIDEVEEHEAAGRSVMLLTTCGYMLQPMLKELRARGVPFGNRYAPRRGDWSPLAPRKGVSASERMMSFLKPQPEYWGADADFWTGGELQNWVAHLSVKGILRHGVKTKFIDKYPTDAMVDIVDMAEWFYEDALEHIYAGDLDWYVANIQSSKASAYEYPMHVLQKRGVAGLRQRPLVIPGTVHCSPPDEPVLTVNRGWVPISELDPESDRLVAYARPTNDIIWGGKSGSNVKIADKGHPFLRSRRWHEGRMITVQSEKSRTRITPEHRVLVRLRPEFMDKYVVYLMRRKNWWRVGVCISGRRPYVSGDVNSRLATEKGDDAWLLGVFATREEAIAHEAYIQGRYGIPGLTFESAKARALTSAQLHAIHESVAPFVASRAHLLLEELGMSTDAPLYTRAPLGDGIKKNSKQGWFLTEASNLPMLNGYIDAATMPDEFLTNGRYRKMKPAPHAATVTVEEYCGWVYGIDVPPYHHYLSGGAVVHNSVKGGQADVVYLWPELSVRGWESWQRSAQEKDAIIRQGYVGMTRAYEELVLCRSAGNRTMWA